MTNPQTAKIEKKKFYTAAEIASRVIATFLWPFAPVGVLYLIAVFCTWTIWPTYHSDQEVALTFLRFFYLMFFAIGVGCWIEEYSGKASAAKEDAEIDAIMQDNENAANKN